MHEGRYFARCPLESSILAAALIRARCTADKPPEVVRQSSPAFASQKGQSKLMGLVGRTSGMEGVRFMAGQHGIGYGKGRYAIAQENRIAWRANQVLRSTTTFALWFVFGYGATKGWSLRSLRPRSAMAEDRVAKKILVADDSPVIRKALRGMFEVEADYDLCAEAENGEEAIGLAIKHRPDLIILDFAMPVMNGIEAAREIKKTLPGVPIILFTQHSDTAMRTAISDSSVDRVVSKNDGRSLLVHIRSLVPV